MAEGDRHERRMAALIHSSMIWGLLLAPAAFYLYYRQRSQTLRAAAAHAFNYQVAGFAVLVAAGLVGVLLIAQRLDWPVVGLLVYLVAYGWIWWCILRAVLRSWNGKDPKYPVEAPILGRGVAT
jgi:uncharacterized Tic20 family protein